MSAERRRHHYFWQSNRIGDVLTEQGRSWMWLSRTSGIDIAELSRWRHGKRLPGERSAPRVAEALGVPFGQVFSDPVGNDTALPFGPEPRERFIAISSDEGFWSRVDVRGDDECWVWTGARNKVTGYGSAGSSSDANGKRQYHTTHRRSWELVNGVIPADMHVLHRCDNRLCVNPNHLFLGTHQDNMADRNRKERQMRGVRHPRAVLTDEIVRRMRQMRRDDPSLTYRQIAKHFGIQRELTAYQAITGRSWKHVEMDAAA